MTPTINPLEAFDIRRNIHLVNDSSDYCTEVALFLKYCSEECNCTRYRHQLLDLSACPVSLYFYHSYIGTLL